MAFLGGKLEPKKSFGNKLAADLGNVLESMAHQRAAEMKVQQDSKFWQSLGVGAKEAASIARQPESIQKAVLDRLEGATLGAQQQQQEQYQPTQYEPEQFQAPQPENFQPKSTYTPEQTESLKSIVNPILRNNLAAQFRQQNQEQPYSLPEQPIDQFNQTAGEQQIARQQQELSNRPQKQYQEPLRLVNPEEKKLRIKEQFDTRERNQIEADKSYQADVKSGEEAKRKLKILESMKKIVNKLSGPTWSNFTGATGTKGGWATEETGRFEKYTEDLIGKGKSVEEIRSERRKYPNTSLSPQSNKILIKEYEQRYKEQVEKADLAKTLKHYNGGQVPVDYDYVINQIEPIQAEPLKKNEILETSQQNQYVEENEQEAQENFITAPLRNIISSGANAISSLANLARLPEDIIRHGQNTRNELAKNYAKYEKNPVEKQKTLKEVEKLEKKGPIKGIATPIVEAAHEIAKKSFPEGYLQPKNQFEETLQDYAAMVPLYILGGGTKSVKDVAGFLARTAVGRVAGEQVEKAGGGTVGNIAARIVVPGLLSTMNPWRIEREFKALEESKYNNLKNIAGDTKISAAPLEEAFGEAWEESKHSAAKTRLHKSIGEWSELIQKGKLPLKELQPLSRLVNKLAYKENNESFKPIASALRKMGRDTLATNPEYGKALTDANKIHSIFASATDMTDFFKDATTHIPVKRAYLIKLGLEIMFENPLAEHIKTISKLAYRFPDETIKYLLEGFEAAATKDRALLFKSAEKIGKMAEESEEK